MYDFGEAEPQHRHMSHLYDFHPGEQITPDTPGLFGAVGGLKARGNFEVDIEWDEGFLAAARILSLSGSECTLRSAWPMAVERNGKEVARSGKKCSNAVFSYYEVTLSTKTGESYIVRNTAGE